jgi:hypothetical protein
MGPDGKLHRSNVEALGTGKNPNQCSILISLAGVAWVQTPGRFKSLTPLKCTTTADCTVSSLSPFVTTKMECKSGRCRGTCKTHDDCMFGEGAAGDGPVVVIRCLVGLLRR